LRDPVEPATARFNELFSEASASNTDIVPRSESDVQDFEILVDKVERAWESARRNAETKARHNVTRDNTRMTDAQIADLRTARRAIDMVMDPMSNPHEATLAWKRAQRLFQKMGMPEPSDTVRDGLIAALPQPVRLELAA